MMRVFVGSSMEQKPLVEWLVDFIRKEYSKILEPVPWTVQWPGGRYTLENLLTFVEESDAAILFWTADDQTWYRDAEYPAPRDNLIFEAGLFIASHGSQRVQLMVPEYDMGDERRNVKVPSDIVGFTYNSYRWVDGPAETTGLPHKARFVCDTLRTLGPRPRLPHILRNLATHTGVEEVRTFVGDWPTMHVQGIRAVADRESTRAVDILATYRIGEIYRVLPRFRNNSGVSVRVCFANAWDVQLIEAYRRKYFDRSVQYIQNAVKQSITQLLGDCEIVEDPNNSSIQIKAVDPPQAKYDIRLTPQRITYSFYRIDEFAFIVPLDMKREQNPPPRAWVFAQDLSPRAFEHYVQEYERMFSEALHVFP
jgi:hypothetical protein